MTELFELRPAYAPCPSGRQRVGRHLFCRTAAGCTTSTRRPGTSWTSCSGRRRGRVADLLTPAGVDAPAYVDDTPLLSRRFGRCRWPSPRSATSAAPTATPTAAASAARPRTCRRRPRWPRSTCCSPRRGGERVNLAFLGGEPLLNRGVLRAATERAYVLAAERGSTHLLDHHQRHPADRRGRRLLRGVRVRGHGQRGRDRAVHDRLRPFLGGQGSSTRDRPGPPLLDGNGGCRSRPGSRSPRATSGWPRHWSSFVGLGFHSVGFSPCCAHRPARRAGPSRAGDHAGGDGGLRGGVRAPGDRRRALPVRQRGDCHARAASRHPPALSVRGGRGLSRGRRRRGLAACHRFVGDPDAASAVTEGIDRRRQLPGWTSGTCTPAALPSCWARYLCGGGCHHEVIARGRRRALHPGLAALVDRGVRRLSLARPDYFSGVTAGDVCVVGGGPAGALAALARTGLSGGRRRAADLFRDHVGVAESRRLALLLLISRSAVEAVGVPVARSWRADHEDVVAASLTLDRGLRRAAGARGSVAPVPGPAAVRTSRVAVPLAWAGRARFLADASGRLLGGRRPGPRHGPSPCILVAASRPPRPQTRVRLPEGGSGGPAAPVMTCAPWSSSTTLGCFPEPPTPAVVPPMVRR